MAEVTIGDYVAPTTVNPYTDAVTALIAAGAGKAATVIVPADKVAKTRRAFGDAANAAGKTARKREETANEDGTVTLVFTVGDKQNRPGRPKDDETVTVAAPAKSGKK